MGNVIPTTERSVCLQLRAPPVQSVILLLETLRLPQSRNDSQVALLSRTWRERSKLLNQQSTEQSRKFFVFATVQLRLR